MREMPGIPFQVSVAVGLGTLSAAMHTVMVTGRNTGWHPSLYFMCLWALGGAGVVISLGSAKRLTGLLVGAATGLIGYWLGEMLAASLWLFGLYPWWVGTWIVLGKLRANISPDGKGWLRGILAGIVSAFPFTLGIILWFESGHPPKYDKLAFFNVWWITFTIAYSILLIDIGKRPEISVQDGGAE